MNGTTSTASWVAPKRSPTYLDASDEYVWDYINLFVNRRAYTQQSHRPGAESGKHYYFQPTDKESRERLPLTLDTVRRHLVGIITIGLYAINPESQRSKWVAIDADYDRAPHDLAELKGELREDGVEAALEMSRRGGHLWILCAEPLLARDCRVYIYNLALRLGVPIRGAAGLREGIEIFPRQDDLAPNEFGNALRGPLGVHRVNCHRYWFYGAESTIAAQLKYLKDIRKLTEQELLRFTKGMTLPEEFHRIRENLPPPRMDRNEFSILDRVAGPRRRNGGNYYTRCPSCAEAGHDRSGDNLSISVADPRKYKCWAGCTKEMIREAVGCPIRR